MDKITLVIGASTNPTRYSNKAINMLRKHGYSVLAYSLRPGEVGDVSFTTEWSDIHKPIDTISLYVATKHQNSKFIQSVIDLEPQRIIFNPGTENIEFSMQAKAADIEPVNACTLVMLSTDQY